MGKANPLLALLLLGLAAMFAVTLWIRTAGPTQIERASVISLTNSPGSEGQSAIVVVETSKGETRKLKAPRRLLVRCEVGDEIELVRRRYATEIGPRGCLPQE